MPEMAYAAKDHGDTALIGGAYHLLVAHRAIGLDDAACADRFADMAGTGIKRSVSYLEKVVGIGACQGSPTWVAIKEIQQIRNLVAHADGRLVDDTKARKKTEDEPRLSRQEGPTDQSATCPPASAARTSCSTALTDPITTSFTSLRNSYTRRSPRESGTGTHRS